MTTLIDWRRIEAWMPTACVVAALLGLLVVMAGIANRQQAVIVTRTHELDRIGGQLNATQALLTALQAQLHQVKMQPAPVCPPPVQVARDDIGHDTPIFGRW